MSVITENRGDASADTETLYTVSLGDVFQGTLTSAGDQDWIRLNLTAGTIYDITFTGMDMAYLALHDSAGEELVPHIFSFDGVAFVYRPSVTGAYYISVSVAQDVGDYEVALTENTRPEGTHDEIAEYLTDGYGNWSGEGRYAFAVAPGGTLSANITALTEDGQQLARWALESWTNVTGIVFEFVDDDTAHITFDDEEEGAYAGVVASGGVIVSSEVSVSAEFLLPGASIGSDALSVYIHEIGHALGLGHAGPYNAFGSYGLDNLFLNDSHQATVMSYFTQGENTYIDASSATPVTPMIADIIAIQNLYGVPDHINSGDTVYGYQSNLDGYLGEFFKLWAGEENPSSPQSLAQPTTFTIYDDGGNDTLDLRTDPDDQRVYLRPEGISDVYGLTGNLVIARDTLVENFIAGSGNDAIVGNAVANYINGRAGDDRIWGSGGDDILEGGAGADRLDGDEGMDWVSYRESDAAVTVNLAENTVQGGHAEGDVLTGIENVIGSGYEDVLTGNDGANRLEGGAGADRLDGGAGEDWVSYLESDTGVTVNLGNNTVAGGHAEGDVIVNFENVTGSGHADVLTGDAGSNQLDGARGNDVLEGRGGADRLTGGDGEDTASYAHSDAAVIVRLHSLQAMGGDAESDTFGTLVSAGYTDSGGVARVEDVPDIEHLRGSAYADALAGDSRDNRLVGGPGADRLYGGPGGGDDMLRGGRGADALYGGIGDDVLEGGADADTLRGGAGADTVSYEHSDAGVVVHLPDGTVSGGHAEGDVIAGFENITGSGYDDAMTGDGGANVLDGGAGADRLDGGPGVDRVSYLGSDAGVVIRLKEGTGDGGHAEGDVIVDVENVSGSAYSDRLVGDNGANYLAGIGGSDELWGGAGDDVLEGGAGADRLFGGAGMDTASYRSSDTGVSVNLQAGTVEGGHAEGDTISAIENLAGSAYRDVLVGDDGVNRLDGAAGDDELKGGIGNDRLIGNLGEDRLYGGAGDDELRGSEGNDRLSGEAGADDLYGGAGDDELRGGADIDQLFGGTGDDRLYGDTGDDELRGGAGNDRLSGNAGADRLDGGGGIDWASYLGSDAGVSINLMDATSEGGHAQGDDISNVENLVGSGYRDVLQGDSGVNILQGLEGDDELRGNGGNDVLEGGAGADRLDGGPGVDQVSYQDSDTGIVLDLARGTGERGHAEGDVLTDIENAVGSNYADELSGDHGVNQLAGGDGDDNLAGDNGADRLEGGDGHDTLRGGAGADRLDGGDGIDDIEYWLSDASITVNLEDGTGEGGYAAGDVITNVEDVGGTRYGDTLIGDNGDNSLRGRAGDDVLQGNDGNDHLDGAEGADRLDGGGGIDTITYWSSDAGVTVNLEDGTTRGGHAEGDVIVDVEGIYGSDFADVLRGDESANGLQGSGGDDEIHGSGGDDFLQGGAGADHIYGSDGDDGIFGEDGDDYIYGDEGDDFLQGGIGADHIYGDEGDDWLEGDDGDDELYGGAGDDLLVGGAGADRLAGGAGDDQLYGHATRSDEGDREGSVDVFIFDADHGDDTIHDFVDGEDKIEISAFNLSGFDELNLSAATSGPPGTIIDLSAYGGGTILLFEFDIADLDATDFLF